MLQMYRVLIKLPNYFQKKIHIPVILLLLLIISLSHFPLEISRLRMSELLKVNPPPILFGERGTGHE